MVITLGQQYNVGEKPTVILYTYIILYKGRWHYYCKLLVYRPTKVFYFVLKMFCFVFVWWCPCMAINVVSVFNRHAGTPTKGKTNQYIIKQ